MNASYARSPQRRTVVAYMRSSRESWGVRGDATGGSQPACKGNPARARLKMSGNLSQVPNAATRDANGGRRASHSKTVVSGLGPKVLLRVRGSAGPRSVSL